MFLIYHKMKKILLIIALCFITNYINAQNEILIHTSSETMIFNSSDVDSLTFKSEQELKKMLIHKHDGEITEIDRSEIDSIKFRAAQEKPIELLASTTSIIANGTDAVTFTVMQDGNDITNVAEIFVNNNKINGDKFSTFTAGTYTAYAKKNEVVSNEISFTAEASSETGTTVVFAEGVTPTSGWYDVNKIDYSTDINMCWAATSSNIIQWWQDRYVAAGNELPAGAISGKGTSSYELALMDMYKEQWNNERGADASHGVTWYFEGRNLQEYASAGSCAQPLPGNDGGYFASVWDEILPHVYHDYTHVIVPDVIEFDNLITREYNGYSIWGNGSGLSNPERLTTFSGLLIEFIRRGVCGLGVSIGAGGGLHSITLWGCEYDNATGIVTKIWLADSDDIKSGPRTPILHECTISMDGGSIRVDGAAQTYYITQLFPVSGYGSR